MTTDSLHLTHGGLRRKILAVEDNDLNREMLVELLKGDYDVIEARDGLEGLEQLEEHYRELSLILLDVYMPHCDGFEFLRRKATDERFDSVPVIVTTAGGSVDDELSCLKLGANDFVVKPYHAEILRNRVGNMVRLRESAALVNRLTWDEISGLYTKEFFYRSVEAILESDAEGQYDVICCDIEHFAVLNDRYGEQKCDELLRELGQRMMRILPGLVSEGRIGAGSFAFLCHHYSNDWDNVLGPGVGPLGLPNASVKLGVYENVNHKLTVAHMCHRATSAIDTIRGRYDVHLARFDDELHRQHLLEQTIRECMEEALSKLEFSVYYQPKHDVHTGRIGGAEALVRWFHPTIGFISPGLFIPIFERNGFITPLDLFVWEEACKEIARCKELGLPIVPISVNASPLDFDVADLPAQIASIADNYGVDHHMLHIELTETAYATNPESVTDMLHELQELGFSTELDDFGSGYSSIVSLNALPLDVMKLDMSMIRKATELNDFRIVDSTIKLAQVLGLRTVVEGVETADEARRVTEMGCDLIQGYFYSKPLTQQEFEDYLRTSFEA